jgi:cation:H+ antiporter
VLILIFIAAAVATWIAGISLASATDVIDDAYGPGEALGGMILLSIVGSLPEAAITISAAVSKDLGIAAGNLIGGVAIQTLVLAIADRFVRRDRPLTSLASSLVPALEGMLVTAVVGTTIISGLHPESAALGSVGVGSIAIVVIWFIGMKVLAGVKDRPDLVLANTGVPTAQPEPAEKPTKHATRHALGVFGVGALSHCLPV